MGEVSNLSSVSSPAAGVAVFDSGVFDTHTVHSLVQIILGTAVKVEEGRLDRSQREGGIGSSDLHGDNIKCSHNVFKASLRR